VIEKGAQGYPQVTLFETTPLKNGHFGRSSPARAGGFFQVDFPRFFVNQIDFFYRNDRNDRKGAEIIGKKQEQKPECNRNDRKGVEIIRKIIFRSPEISSFAGQVLLGRNASNDVKKKETLTAFPFVVLLGACMPCKYTMNVL
jgi:hypothetical protein